MLEIDAATLTPGDTIRLGSDETNLTFGAGAVLLADGTGNSITRIDAVTHSPHTSPESVSTATRNTGLPTEKILGI